MHNVLVLHSGTISFYVMGRQKSPKDKFEQRESIRFIYCYFLKEVCRIKGPGDPFSS